MTTESPSTERAREGASDLTKVDIRALLGRLADAPWAEVALVLGITLAAALPRLLFLSDVPPGLHGDEAWTGLDAQRVLDEGWIGVYTKSALGQPAGPLYWAAPFIALFGDSIFAVRLSMALLGIITIPVAYLAFRLMFDRSTAAFGALFLGFGLWHLHYSRIAFMVISWPLIEMIMLVFLFLGLRTGKWVFYGLAGLAFGAGVYTYNAYPVFAVPVTAFLAWMLLRQRREDLLPFGGKVALLLAAALVATVPLILYATDPANAYLNHHRGVSLFETEEWEAAGTFDKADILWDRARNFFVSAYWNGEPDGADASGEDAMVDRLSAGLIVVGSAILIARWRKPGAVLALLMLLLLPLGSIISLNAMFRRSLGLAPFVALVAAVPMALWWKRTRELTQHWRTASYAGIGVVVIAVGYLNVSAYADRMESHLARFTFAKEMAEASSYINRLPEGTAVYFYSGRWSFNYETRQYLAPDAQGEDRSEEFGAYSLAADRSRDVAFVFLEPYTDRLQEVRALYPGGEVTESRDGDEVNFVAYYLPRDPDAAPPPEPSPTPVPEETEEAPGAAADRDAQRVADLEAVAGVLQQYREEHGAYPDTGGGIQTLCVFVELDEGCALNDIDRIPAHDPLGDASVNGYWYASDGRSFVVYAQRETDGPPECDEHPDHLGRFDSLICVRGP